MTHQTPDDKQAWEGPDTDLNKAYDAGPWGLQLCDKCELMTNHDDSGCLRCKKVEVSTDNACKNNQTPDEFLDEVLSGFAMHAAWWGFDKALDTPKRHTTSSRTESLNITKQLIKDYYASEINRVIGDNGKLKRNINAYGNDVSVYMEAKMLAVPTVIGKARNQLRAEQRLRAKGVSND